MNVALASGMRAADIECAVELAADEQAHHGFERVRIVGRRQ